MRAYFDTNIVNHIHDYDGITPPEVVALLNFANAGTLRVAGASAVAEELMQTAAKNPQRARSLGTLYGLFIERGHLLQEPLPLVMAAVRAHASGKPISPPFRAVSEDEIQTFLLLTACCAPATLIDAVVVETSRGAPGGP